VLKGTSVTDFCNLSSPLSWRRPLLALVAGLALVFGAVAPHDMAVERAGGVSRIIEIAETAVHPDAPAHFEEATIEVHPGCTACLLQLGSSTVLGRPLAATSTLPSCGNVAASLTRISSAAPSLSGPARAPPLSSPSA
jgi:hypothetical protein